MANDTLVPSVRGDTITAVLCAQAAAQAQHTYVIAPETQRSLDYGGLWAFAAQLNAYFDVHDVAKGSRVAMLLPNGLTATALFLATMAAGRVITPLSALAQRSQLAYVLGHCEPAIVFTDTEHADLLRELLGSDRAGRIVTIDPSRIDTGPWTGKGGLDYARLIPLDEQVAQLDQNALLMYTSGTTGKPKGVPLSHSNLLHAARSVAQWHRLTPDDRVLSALPLYHINGQVIATLTPLVSGGSLVAPQKFSVTAWWQAAVQHQCTWINMVPTIVAYLLNAAEQAPQAFPNIRFGRSASAPLPPEQQRRFEARFGFPIVEAMGMTESASVVFCNPMQAEQRKIGSPGKPIGVDAKVVDSNGNELPVGQTGEIWLRGRNVMAGYYQSPEQTAQALTTDGWLKSGDLGMRDEDGFYFITGRLKELIIKGGENIAPREIDEALLRHPAILEAAAVGIPDENYGQEILAAVVLKPGASLSEQELRVFCHAELGKYKTPCEYRFLAELPKGPSGKVQRLKLLEQIE